MRPFSKVVFKLLNPRSVALTKYSFASVSSSNSVPWYFMNLVHLYKMINYRVCQWILSRFIICLHNGTQIKLLGGIGASATTFERTARLLVRRHPACWYDGVWIAAGISFVFLISYQHGFPFVNAKNRGIKRIPPCSALWSNIIYKLFFVWHSFHVNTKKMPLYIKHQ